MHTRAGWWLLFGLCGACGPEPAAQDPGPEPRLVDLKQLAAEVKQNLGRGALVNLWATW